MKSLSCCKPPIAPASLDHQQVVKLITLGNCIYRTDSFESMKLMIVTDVFKRIDHDMLLTLGDEGYRLMIRELGPADQMAHIDHGHLINLHWRRWTQMTRS